MRTVSLFRQAVQGVLVPHFTKNFAEKHSIDSDSDSVGLVLQESKTNDASKQ